MFTGTIQAKKLKSCEMKEGWMKKDEGWIMKDERWWFQAVEGLCRLMDRRTNKQKDICECKVTFLTEKNWPISINKHILYTFTLC